MSFLNILIKTLLSLIDSLTFFNEKQTTDALLRTLYLIRYEIAAGFRTHMCSEMACNSLS